MSRTLLKLFQSFAIGLLAVIGAYVTEALEAFDPATVTSEPLVAGLVVLVIAALARGVGYLVGKLPIATT